MGGAAIILEQLADVGTRAQRSHQRFCASHLVFPEWITRDAQVDDRDNEAAGQLIRRWQADRWPISLLDDHNIANLPNTPADNYNIVNTLPSFSLFQVRNDAEWCATFVAAKRRRAWVSKDNCFCEAFTGEEVVKKITDNHISMIPYCQFNLLAKIII